MAQLAKRMCQHLSIIKYNADWSSFCGYPEGTILGYYAVSRVTYNDGSIEILDNFEKAKQLRMCTFEIESKHVCKTII